MQLEHLAIWTCQLESLKHFYCQYFGATASIRYHNSVRQFTSYFLTFANGTRLELMHQPDLLPLEQAPAVGLAHMAFSTGSEAAVDQMTETLRQAGYSPLDGPRRTGDGYYESTFRDPDGNLIELTV